jgi:hypothetical protein
LSKHELQIAVLNFLLQQFDTKEKVTVQLMQLPQDEKKLSRQGILLSIAKVVLANLPKLLSGCM